MEDKLFITPVYGVNLNEDSLKDLKIGLVTFTTFKRFRKTRLKFGLEYTIGSLEHLNSSTSFFKNIITNFKVIAIVRYSDSSDVEWARNEINKSISILCASYMSFSIRKIGQKILTYDRSELQKGISLGLKSALPSFMGARVNSVKLELNDTWSKFHRKYWFIPFLRRILNKKGKNSKWEKMIIEAVKIIGQAQSSERVEDAFLKNIVALEMLLVENKADMKKCQVVVKRLGFLLDWTENWSQNRYKEKIVKLYTIRNNYMHEGKAQDITLEQLVILENILFNVLYNIVNCIDVFNSKGKLVEYSDNYEHEKKLKIVSNKYQLKKLRFFETQRETKLNTLKL
ncbi:HEPN domain-containing protein [Flavicella sp.]|uniref:HEPN domain-containing protein n=1 Tax=Flavicella sp. TaxID=2957742 RepID=UPI0026166A25|nr:HEPN domain-containing protein [Flavicella sp.]MDG1804302.1 HEPN domain-containing protein [Flavicella sp.]